MWLNLLVFWVLNSRREKSRAGFAAYLLVSGQPYDETKAFATTPASTARRLQHLQNQAQALNMKLIPV